MWIAEIVFVEINQVQPQPVLHLTLAEIVQIRLPLPVVGQIFRYMPGQKNMPGITAIHDALRHVDPRSGDVRLVVNIGDLIHWAAVHSHPQLDMRMPFLQRSADLERTSHRLFRTLEKQERHPVSAWYWMSLPFVSAARKHSVFRTIWLRSCSNSICSLTSSLE